MYLNQNVHPEYMTQHETSSNSIMSSNFSIETYWLDIMSTSRERNMCTHCMFDQQARQPRSGSRWNLKTYSARNCNGSID
jgi:hypothetical protein